MTSEVTRGLNMAAHSFDGIAETLRNIDPVASLPAEFQLPALRQLGKLLIEHAIAAMDVASALHGVLNITKLAEVGGQSTVDTKTSAEDLIDVPGIHTALKKATAALDLTDVVAQVNALGNDKAFMTTFKTEVAKNKVDLGIVRDALKKVDLSNVQVINAFETTISAIQAKEAELGNSSTSTVLRSIQGDLHGAVEQAKSSVVALLASLDTLFQKAA